MKILLAVMIVSWLLSGLAYSAADRPGDDFGTGLLAWLAIAISIVLTVIYLSLAFWNHRLI